MIGFKDKTFCNFKDCKHFETCGRAFTELEHYEAIRWWGDVDFPISFFLEKPSCYEKD